MRNRHPISLLVFGKFIFPEFNVAFWIRRPAATGMAMPKTAMNENRPLLGFVRKVR